MRIVVLIVVLALAAPAAAMSLGEVEASRAALVEPMNAAAAHHDVGAAQRICVALRVPAAEFETAVESFVGDPPLHAALLGEAHALRRAVDACALGLMRDYAHELLRWQQAHQTAATRATQLRTGGGR